MSQRRIAVIGAGMAGLACARYLHDRDLHVDLYDKSRGTGGRMASRRHGDGHFDHGAIAFRATDPDFNRAVEKWSQAGAVQQWMPRSVDLQAGGAATVREAPVRYVGVPRMSALTRSMLADIPLHTQVQVKEIQQEESGWRLLAADGSTTDAYDSVVVAVPAPQAADLLNGHTFAQVAKAAGAKPAWALLLEVESRADIGWDEAFCEGDSCERIIRHDSKPGRDELGHWVLHMRPDWSAACIDEDPADMLPRLREELARWVPELNTSVISAKAHRWRFGHAGEVRDEPFLYDAHLQLGACGDWFQKGNVEGAWLSGRRLAQAIIQ